MKPMQGKLCLVTGGTSGIGYYTALEIARLGATVTIVGKNENRCIHAVANISRDSANPAVDYLLADLSSQAQIRSIAGQFYQKYGHLDVLVNNAGAFFLRRRLSMDGIEMTFAVNHLAYFLLTILLLDALKASPSARVVNVSSGSHFSADLDFENLQLNKHYNPLQAYRKSKLANILFSNELSRRLSGTSVTSNALHPGLVATDIWKKVNPMLTPLLYTFVKWVGLAPNEGADTSIYLATSPEVEGISGKYFVNCQPVSSGPATNDMETARRLWEISEKLVGIQAAGSSHSV